MGGEGGRVLIERKGPRDSRGRVDPNFPCVVIPDHGEKKECMELGDDGLREPRNDRGFGKKTIIVCRSIRFRTEFSTRSTSFGKRPRCPLGTGTWDDGLLIKITQKESSGGAGKKWYAKSKSGMMPPGILKGCRVRVRTARGFP